ncbi:uncharacterized protein DS421_13g440560 [Arachis hypogaea]|nr:uncharacterized protein DS421_13g440560 [Arachis hypogaea]
MTAKMLKSHVQIKTLPVYRESEEVDDTHLYRKYKGALLVAEAQDGNQNTVPIAFAIIEGEMANAWEFFLTNLRRYVVTIDGAMRSVFRDGCWHSTGSSLESYDDE